jgi:hypothetical protein
MRHVTTKSRWFQVEHEERLLIWLENLKRGKIFEVPSLVSPSSKKGKQLVKFAGLYD